MSTSDKICSAKLNDLRDEFLKSFGEGAILGRLFDRKHKEVNPGQSIVEWIKETAILNRRSIKEDLTPTSLRAFNAELGVVYTRVISLKASIQAAHDELASLIEARESQLAEVELAKYEEGGEYWDAVAKKPNKRTPGKESLLAYVRTFTIEPRAVLGRLLLEVKFFLNLCDALEFQRRIVKEYGDSLAMDPALRGM